MKPIDDPDTTNVSPAYWEAVLLSHGLGMQRGKASAKTSLRGGIKELVSVEQIEYQKSSGRVSPKGRGPDK